MEAAKHFAVRIQQEAGADVKQQIQVGYALALGKPIEKEKLAILKSLYIETLEDFQKNSAAAKAITEGLEIKKDIAAIAAMTVVANTMMNLDEFMMK